MNIKFGTVNWIQILVKPYCKSNIFAYNDLYFSEYRASKTTKNLGSWNFTHLSDKKMAQKNEK